MSMNPETAMRQASMTAATYMDQAIADIDERFHIGYSAKNPQLVAAIATIAAADFENSCKVGMVDFP
jgi:hypothetical protein